MILEILECIVCRFAESDAFAVCLIFFPIHARLYGASHGLNKHHTPHTVCHVQRVLYIAPKTAGAAEAAANLALDHFMQQDVMLIHGSRKLLLLKVELAAAVITWTRLSVYETWSKRQN